MEHRIEFDNVWKKFHRGELHDSLRDLIPAVAKRVLGRQTPRDELEEDQFWALKNVSFRVEPGETLGIIGPNGAGKSTILKILTKILRPNLGRCSVPERVGSLIEIGAGFHPDLTGRENIYLQGAIVGMKRDEIEEKYDDILGFSELGPFIDTQVKRYSSGMNARLGFSIAAHLDPDALLVDEVLSVGDYSFQKKAFERIAEMANRNIPVVIISHQLERIGQLCTHAILLEKGAVVHRGDPAETVSAYISRQTMSETSPDSDSPVHLEDVVLLSRNPVPSGERIQLRIEGTSSIRRVSRFDPEELSIGIRIQELKGGQRLFTCGTIQQDLVLPDEGAFEIHADLQMNLPPTIYSINTVVWNLKRGEEVQKGPSLTLQVEEGTPFLGSVQCNPRLDLTTETRRVGAASTRKG